MTRIQKGSVDAEVLEKQLSQLDERLKNNNRGRIFSCFNCLLYILVALIILGGFVSVWLAKSGLVDVPYLTKRYYVKPEPVYTVTAQNILSTNDFITKLLTAGAQKLLNKNTAPLSAKEIPISEGQLTGLLQQMLKASQYSQIALHDSLMDIYIQTSSKAIFRLQATPVVKDGSVRFKTVDFKIGQANLPNFFASLIGSLALDSSIATLQKALGGVGEVQGVRVDPGQLIIIVK